MPGERCPSGASQVHINPKGPHHRLLHRRREGSVPTVPFSHAFGNRELGIGSREVESACATVPYSLSLFLIPVPYSLFLIPVPYSLFPIPCSLFPSQLSVRNGEAGKPARLYRLHDGFMAHA